ncbi:hypothetical protein N7456_000401 [Penicillium angulare]|uniref:Amidase n=1 Tax=Penicillium angulare TaxID=116970 RepID=A0A9W9GBY2_9EURO|nr:hypothetical protein N7456_000401 [Penicillium angulare]
MVFVQEHRVATIGNLTYYVRNAVASAVTSLPENDHLQPAVVITLNDSELSLNALDSAFTSFESHDDVFQRGFIDGGFIIVQHTKGSTQSEVITDDVSAYLQSHSSTVIFWKSDSDAPFGPYFTKGGNLHQAWRLYEDVTCSFVSTVFPADDGDEFHFRPLPVSAYTGLYPVVAVPSRLYFSKDKNKPLNGKRITIKDNFHLAGAVTTMGSRSYTSYYGFQKETSTYVKELILQGAVILGKTKMGAFTGSETPPEKIVDYLAPFSPRGDGYQGPSGSSSGAGSSIAAYDWVDISIGTDTTGSIRMPAASYGVWGIRATSNMFSLKGVMPSVAAFDALGLVSRTSHEILDLYSSAGLNKTAFQRPTRILYPTDFYPMKNAQQQTMNEAFLHALESYLGVKHQKISLIEEWAKTGPAQGRETPLDEYMRNSGYWPNFYDGYHVYDDLIAGHQREFEKKVYTSPFMTTRWQRGIDTTKEERDRGIAECETVAAWIYSEILTAGSIMLLPLGRPGANYRDLIPEPSRGGPPETAFSPCYLPTTIGAPHIVVPIGQNPFESRVSGNIEYAPIVGSLVGPKGTDVMLLSIAQGALDYNGWPSKVLTGRNIFHLGDNVRNSVIESSE